MRNVFTTGQVAKICRVSPRTVTKWFDSGRLKGFRIPLSEDRRIPLEDLVRFFKESGMPLSLIGADTCWAVLTVAADDLVVRRLRELLPEEEGYRHGRAADAFDAGIVAALDPPGLVVLDLALGRHEGVRIAGRMRSKFGDHLALVALANEDESDEREIRGAFRSLFRKPFDVALLAEHVRAQREYADGLRRRPPVPKAKKVSNPS